MASKRLLWTVYCFTETAENLATGATTTHPSCPAREGVQDDSSGDDDNDSCNSADNLTNNALRRRNKRRLSKGLVCICFGFLCRMCCGCKSLVMMIFKFRLYVQKYLYVLWNYPFVRLWYIDIQYVHFGKYGFGGDAVV